jgi:hypothetical protein
MGQPAQMKQRIKPIGAINADEHSLWGRTDEKHTNPLSDDQPNNKAPRGSGDDKGAYWLCGQRAGRQHDVVVGCDMRWYAL